MSMTVVDCPPAEAQTEGHQQRCSEAMRRGARAHEQTRYMLYDPIWHRTCALGALAVGLRGREAIERQGVSDLYALVLSQTGVDLRRMVSCPAGGHMEQLDTAITTLNDTIGWSREQIADWLESLGL